VLRDDQGYVPKQRFSFWLTTSYLFLINNLLPQLIRFAPPMARCPPPGARRSLFREGCDLRFVAGYKGCNPQHRACRPWSSCGRPQKATAYPLRGPLVVSAHLYSSPRHLVTDHAAWRPKNTQRFWAQHVYSSSWIWTSEKASSESVRKVSEVPVE
jgi:hypothetical protein